MVVRALEADTNGSPAQLRDIAEDAWHMETIFETMNAGLIEGYEDGSFRPHQLVTMEELAVMLARALEHAGAASSDLDASLSFSDSGDIPELAKPAVAAMMQRGKAIRRTSSRRILNPQQQRPLPSHLRLKSGRFTHDPQ